MKNFLSNQSKHSSQSIRLPHKYQNTSFAKLFFFIAKSFKITKHFLLVFFALTLFVSTANAQGLFMVGAGPGSTPSPMAAAPITTIGITNTGSLNQNGGSTFNGNVGIAMGNLTLGMGRLSVAGKSFLLDDVGIGHNNPNARLDVRDGTFVVSGTTGGVGGTGDTRFIWVPSQQAFGAGTGIDWGTIGMNSVAIGNSVDVIGSNSFAFGENVSASGDNAFAFGNGLTTAGGDGSFAFGTLAVATGDGSTANGDGVIALGDYSTARGRLTAANGDNATSSGLLTVANGDNATAAGELSLADGDNALGMLQK